MHVVLLEPDAAICEHWSQRLKAADTDVCTITEDTDWENALDRTQAAMALCRVELDDTNPEFSAELLRHHSGYVVAIVPDGNHELHRLAYESGFDDCIEQDCAPEELHAKLAHAEHLRKLDQRLAQAQKLESIGELAAGIAHEINTPIQYVGDNTRFVKEAYEDLGVVLTACQEIVGVLESGENPEIKISRLRDLMDDADLEYLSEEIPSAINQTLDGIDRVTNIVRAMKEFAHPGNSEMTLTDLAQAIDNTVMVARNEWKYVAEMVTQFDPGLPQVPALPGELNQVLLNMIVNASHAIGEALGSTPESKGTITIETRQRCPYVEIRISDTGKGIPPENLDRIFKPFFTTKAAGKGTGQGLAIAHEVIVEKHRGRIDVESKEGVGTTFIIQLPLTQEESSCVPVDSASTGITSSDEADPSMVF